MMNGWLYCLALGKYTVGPMDALGQFVFHQLDLFLLSPRKNV